MPSHASCGLSQLVSAADIRIWTTDLPRATTSRVEETRLGANHEFMDLPRALLEFDSKVGELVALIEAVE